MTVQPSICLDDVWKTYGTIQALRGVSLEVHPGEIFGLLGPNGAGKTTALNLMSGLLKPTQGRVSVLGLDPQRNAYEVKSRLAYVPEEAVLHEYLTGQEYLDLVYRIRRRDCTSDGTVDEWLTWFQLGRDDMNRLIKAYSRGMRQKILIISALVLDPDVLLLDEPLTGLDVYSALQLEEFLNRCKQAGKTIVLSTHLMQVAEQLCDRVGILQKGDLVFLGDLPKVRQALLSESKPSLRNIVLSLMQTENHAQ